MTLSVHYADDDKTPAGLYYPQFSNYDSTNGYYTSVTTTVKPDRRTDVVVWVDKWGSSTPSSYWDGCVWYDTANNKIRRYHSSQWNEGDDLVIDAYYFQNSRSVVCTWDGSTMRQVTLGRNYIVVIPLAGHGMDLPSSGYKEGDWYYSETDGYLYNWIGSAWRTRMYVSNVESLYILVSYQEPGSDFAEIYEMVHYAVSGVHNLRKYYFYAWFYVQTKKSYPYEENQFVHIIPTGVESSQAYCNLYTQTYYDTGTEYNIQVTYLRGNQVPTSSGSNYPAYLLSGDNKGSNSETFKTVNIQGRSGSIATPSVTLSVGGASSFYKTSDEFTFTGVLTPDSSNPASFLRPYGAFDDGERGYNKYESEYGITWKIVHTGGDTGTWSLISDDAIAQGRISRIGGSSDYNTSTFSCKLNDYGSYMVHMRGYYRLSSTSYNLKSTAVSFYVYNPSKPVIAIDSVAPSEYQSGSADPLDGKAPYTVVFKDNSASTDSGQIPQERIIIDFGDSDSGTDNTVVISNSSNSLITIPNQTHIYDGYTGYVAKMTIIDKRGDSATGSVVFEPNKNPRIISTPTITYSPSSLVAPVLATGEANVAGYPLPTVYWHYEYDDYEGDEEGETVEMSLIKACASGEHYTITCTPEDLATTTWTPEITAPSSVSDDSQTMHDFDLVVLDSSGNAIDWCKQHSSIQYIEYYQDLDVFSFEIPETYAYAQYLQEGNYLILGYKNKARLMQVTYRGRNGSTITISGESAFPERITITATKSTAGDGYDTQAYTGETLIRYFIASCLTDPYPDTTHTPSTQPRGADFVVFGADGETGGTVTYSARYNRLRDVINEICSGANLGYTITARQAGLTKAGLKVTQGTDRTYTSGGSDMVVFSPKRLKNCTIESDQSALSRNVSIGAGAGVGNYRTYSYSGEETTTGFNRREMFTDAGDSADDAEVTRMSELALKEDRQLSIRIRVLPTCQWAFGTDYNVGDVVTLESPDRGSLDLQIYSAEYCRRATGDELYLNLGYECASAPTLIRRTAKENTYARK